MVKEREGRNKRGEMQRLKRTGSNAKLQYKMDGSGAMQKRSHP